jgi:DNA-binding MarR family transcriptional regulator
MSTRSQEHTDPADPRAPDPNQHQSPPPPATGDLPLHAGSRFHRFLRYSHILSSALRDVLEERFLSAVSTEPLTRAQFCFLKLITLNADLQVGEVARSIGVTPSAGSKNVDKLERLGLVVRAGAPDDRRARVVSASDKGRRLVHDYEALKAQHVAPVIDRLGKERVDMLCDLLEQVCIGLLKQEQPLEGSCLRCAGYLEPHCAIESLHGGCALRERRTHASGRSAEGNVR